MNNDEIIEKIKELNEKYMPNNQNGIKISNINFKIIEGCKPIILSAPHAVRQNTQDKIKAAERYTGAIVEYLCEKTGANGIIRTCNFGDNPNSENEGYGLKYKNAILNLIEEKDIKCLIDFHGCKDTYGFDFDIGTNNKNNINNKDNYLKLIQEELENVGIVTIDEKFKASKDEVISNYISKHKKVACFQIEISKRMRENNQTLVKVLNQFESLILKLMQN